LAAAMKFLRSVKGYRKMDRVINENVRRELGIFSLTPKTQENRTDRNISKEWMEPVLLMKP
jgi:hypothetical protein